VEWRGTFDLDEVRSITLAAAVASRSLLQQRPAAEPRHQAGRDIKLAEDEASEAVIVATLRERSPLPILSEEAGWIGEMPAPGEPYWAVDPLDGSFNFHRGVPLCCTAVAFCTDRVAVAGAVFDFNRNELFWGGRGIGLFLNDIPLVRPKRPKTMLATGFPARADHSPAGIAKVVERTAEWTKIRMIGSAALSLAWIAAGRFDAYEETGISWWDVAAGLALIEAAGGTVAVAPLTPGAPLDAPLWVRAAV
jgi:myo-inositol-1(or 4)-monophosphatase